MSVPATVIYMTLYDRLKLVYGFKPGENNVFSPMFAGVSARGKILTQCSFNFRFFVKVSMKSKIKFETNCIIWKNSWNYNYKLFTIFPYLTLPLRYLVFIEMQMNDLYISHSSDLYEWLIHLGHFIDYICNVIAALGN